MNIMRMAAREDAKAATVLLACLLWLSAACAHQSVKKSLQTGAPAATQLAAAVPVGTSNDEPSMRASALIHIPELKPVYFDFNSDELKPESRAVLQSNAEWIKDHDARIQVAGNCDQRGTVEYNLALGQRRAEAVRSYYMHMGVAADHIATISYGKERLACTQSTEACWQRNRRADSLEAVARNVNVAGLPAPVP
jgi:peptidoglycan-associated lipoprotein